MADRRTWGSGGWQADLPGRDGSRALRHRLLDPVAVVLVLAGIFDGIAGNGIHAVLLVGAGVGLVVKPPAPSPDRKRVRISRRVRPWWHLALPVSVAFGIVVGALERYTWPVTFAVVVPGVVGLMVASRQPLPDSDGEPMRRIGVYLWMGLILSIAVFELVTFILQSADPVWPSPWPTLSRLFNEVVVGHIRQGFALTVWLLIGWWLVERGER